MKKILRKFPKINFIVGRKQLVIAGLTVVLGAAVFVNYQYAKDQTKVIDTDTNNYGQAALVSADNSKNTSKETDSDYFAQARLDKQASRDEAKEFLATALNGGDRTGEENEVLSQDAMALSAYIESETKIETMLKAQGFTDVLCYLSDKGANVIVKTDGLTSEEAAKIKNALISEVSVPSDKITIVEIS